VMSYAGVISAFRMIAFSGSAPIMSRNTVHCCADCWKFGHLYRHIRALDQVLTSSAASNARSCEDTFSSLTNLSIQLWLHRILV